LAAQSLASTEARNPPATSRCRFHGLDQAAPPECPIHSLGIHLKLNGGSVGPKCPPPFPGTPPRLGSPTWVLTLTGLSNNSYLFHHLTPTLRIEKVGNWALLEGLELPQLLSLGTVFWLLGKPRPPAHLSFIPLHLFAATGLAWPRPLAEGPATYDNCHSWAVLLVGLLPWLLGLAWGP